MQNRRERHLAFAIDITIPTGVMAGDAAAGVTTTNNVLIMPTLRNGAQ